MKLPQTEKTCENPRLFMKTLVETYDFCNTHENLGFLQKSSGNLRVFAKTYENPRVFIKALVKPWGISTNSVKIPGFLFTIKKERRDIY